MRKEMRATLLLVLLVVTFLCLSTDAAPENGEHFTESTGALKLDPLAEAETMAKLTKFTESIALLAGLDPKGSQKMAGGDDEEGEPSQSNGRQMSSQQSAAVVVSSSRAPLPQCNTSSKFFFAYLHVIEACQGAGASRMTSTPDWSNFGKANMAFKKLCKTKCAGAMAGILARPESSTCLGHTFGSLLVTARVLGALCSAPTYANASDTCGAHVAVSGIFTIWDKCRFPMTYRNRTRCRLDSDCYWDSRNYCQKRPTTELLDRYCSPCMELLVSALGDTNGNKYLSQCSKVDGKFCLPAVVSEMLRTDQSSLERDWTSRWLGFNTSFRQPVCTQPWLHQCLTQHMTRSFFLPSVTSAVSSLKSCLKTYSSYISPSWKAYSTSRMEACMKSYQSTMVSSERLATAWHDYCKTGGPTGDNCQAMVSHPPSDLCVQGVAVSGLTCNATCAPLVKSTLDTWGCCLGDVAPHMYRQFFREDFPYHVINRTQIYNWTSPVGGYNLTQLGSCSTEVSTAIDAGTGASCTATPSNYNVSLQFDLQMNMTEFEALADGHHHILVDAVKRDVATIMGVLPSNIIYPAPGVPQTEPPVDLTADLTLTVSTLCKYPDGVGHACFGYTNPTSKAAVVPQVSTPAHPNGLNYVDVSGSQKTVTEFLPGAHVCAFGVNFSSTTATWHVIAPDGTAKEATATLSSATAACNSSNTAFLLRRRQWVPTPPEVGSPASPPSPPSPSSPSGGFAPSTPSTPGAPPSSPTAATITILAGRPCNTSTGSNVVCFGYLNPYPYSVTIDRSNDQNTLEPKHLFGDIATPTVFKTGYYPCAFRVGFRDYVQWRLVSPSGTVSTKRADDSDARYKCAFERGNHATKLRFSFLLQTQDANFTQAAAAVFSQRLAADTLDMSHTAKMFAEHCPRCRIGADIIVRKHTDTARFTNPLAPEDECFDDSILSIFPNIAMECEALEDHWIHNTTFRAQNNLTVRNMVREVICTSACASGYKTLLRGRAAACLPASVRALVSVEIARCSKDRSGTYCGAYIDRSRFLYKDCSRYDYSSTLCKILPGCRYHSTTRKCTPKLSEEQLKSVCDTKCIPKLAATLARLPHSSAESEMSMETSTCTRDFRGGYCQATIEDELDSIASNGGLFTPETLDELCTNGTKRRCFRRLRLGDISQLLRKAEATFIECVEGSFMFSSSFPTQCLSTLKASLQKVHEQRAIVNNLCSMNNNFTHPSYCLAFGYKYMNSSCLSRATRPNSPWCTRSCIPELEGIVHDMGCCLGTLQQVFGSRPISLKNTSYDTPRFRNPVSYGVDAPSENATEAPPTPQPTAAPTDAPTDAPETEAPETLPPVQPGEMLIMPVRMKYLLQLYTRCSRYDEMTNSSLQNIGVRAHFACNITRSGATMRRNLKLGTLWRILRANPKQRHRIMDHLKIDLGNKIGVSIADFTRTDLHGNGTASGRRAEAADDSPTTFEFEVSPEYEEDMLNASSQFDYLVDEGRLTLPIAAGMMAEECDECEDEASGFQTSAETIDIASSSSAATSLLATLSVVAASLMCVILL